MNIKRPMLLSSLLAIVCVVAVYYCSLAIFAAIIALCGGLMLNLNKRQKVKMTVILFCVTLVVLSLGVSLLKIGSYERLSGEIISEELVINEQPYKGGNGFTAEAVCISGNTVGKADKIKLYFDNADLYVGDVVSARFEISPIKTTKYKASYYSENVFAVGYVEEISSVQTKNSWLCILPKLRRSINEILNAAPVSYQAGSLASAVTVGDKSGLSADFEDTVKAAGVSHVFVVSGMHLVILMGGLMSLFERLFYNKYFYATVSFFGVLLISVICGFTMSVIRAAVMYWLLAAAPLFGRDNDPLNSLGTTVCLVLVFTPYAIFSVAFQLSVLSTLGILLLTKFISDKLCSLLHIKRRLFIKVVEAVSVTVSATVMTAPVCVYYFGYLSTVALITNLLITHAVTYALLLNALGIITGLIFGIGHVSSDFIYLAGVLSEYSIKIINCFGNLPFSIVPLPRWTVIAFIIIALALVLLYLIDKKHKYILSRRV